MLHHPNIDPVALSLGPIQVHWYGLMYLLGFWGCWWLAVRRGRMAHVGWSAQQVSDVLFYIVMGVILGDGSATPSSTTSAAFWPTRW